MTNSIKISVVMGCYNQRHVLERVLLAYEQQSLDRSLFEVIVVDSSSTDGSSEWLTGFKPAYTFRPTIQPNRGKAAARNVGVSQAEGQFIIITDADMIPHPKFIEGHLNAHLASQKPTCFEGLAWNLPTLEWPPVSETLMPQVGTHPKNLARLGWYYFLTGNLSFPKATFDAFNGFDEQFTGYGWEDLELGYRLSKAKITLLYLHSAINYHFHVVHPEDELVRCVDKGRSARYMLSKHPELKWFLGLNPISTFIFPRISETGSFFKWVNTSCLNSPAPLRHRFGLWFLKEFYYLRGIMSV